MAHIALHFNCSPLDLDQEQILDYLHVLKSQNETPSDSFFKHTVYGLRYAYRVFGMKEMRVVRQGKGRKDRYVPLSEMQIRGLKKYFLAENPVTWCFNGNDSEGGPVPLSSRGIQWIVREARKRSGIQKEITAHILRHSYATHLLEMGLDIMSLKDLLGHADIQTTLIYLHVAQSGRQKPFSPLDRLYNQ